MKWKMSWSMRKRKKVWYICTFLNMFYLKIDSQVEGKEEENSLDLLMPYRELSFGIEILLWQIKECSSLRKAGKSWCLFFSEHQLHHPNFPNISFGLNNNCFPLDLWSPSWKLLCFCSWLKCCSSFFSFF